MNLGFFGREEVVFSKACQNYDVVLIDPDSPENLAIYYKDANSVEYLKPRDRYKIDFVELFLTLNNFVLVFDEIDEDIISSNKDVVFILFKKCFELENCYCINENKLTGSPLNLTKVESILKIIEII